MDYYSCKFCLTNFSNCFGLGVYWIDCTFLAWGRKILVVNYVIFGVFVAESWSEFIQVCNVRSSLLLAVFICEFWLRIDFKVGLSCKFPSILFNFWSMTLLLCFSWLPMELFSLLKTSDYYIFSLPTSFLFAACFGDLIQLTNWFEISFYQLCLVLI